MVTRTVLLVLCAFVVFNNVFFCEGQHNVFRNFDTTESPLPFPSCRVDSIDCLRRGLRTFFILMDSGHLGMKPIDPIILNSVAISLPEQQISFLLRKVNVTGARWTKLLERRINLEEGKNGVIFSTDLHVTAEINVNMAGRHDPYISFLTMDIQGVESNVTYSWSGEKGIDNEDYIVIGPERIAVRNSRTPTYFLQPKDSKDAYLIEEMLQMKQSVVDHLSNEITTELMHFIVDNFRLFASKVPVRHYYKYY